MKEKKISSFSRLMEFAKNYKSFTYISLVLSAVSSVLALLPFYYIWKIIKEVLDVMPNFQNATELLKTVRLPLHLHCCLCLFILRLCSALIRAHLEYRQICANK